MECDPVSDYRDPARVLAVVACIYNDTALLDRAFSMARERDRHTFRRQIVREAICINSIIVLNHLIKLGLSIDASNPSDVPTYPRLPSIATLQFLLAHGWNINSWHISGDPSFF